MVLGRTFDPSWEEVDLLDQVDLLPGDRVLDVSHEVSLPFSDGSFDVVVWRQGLGLLPARPSTLTEMRRVLAPQGRAVVSVWGRIERMPVVLAMTNVLQVHGYAGSAAAVRALFSLSEPADLRAFLANAGFERIRVRSVLRTIGVPSVTALVRQCVPDVSVADEPELVADLELRCARWADADGLRLTMEEHTAVASA